MLEYNPAYKEQRKQIKYKEDRSIEKVNKTSEKSIDKQKEILYSFCINKKRSSAPQCGAKRIQCAQTRSWKRMAAVKSSLRKLRKEMT